MHRYRAPLVFLALAVVLVAPHFVWALTAPTGGIAAASNCGSNQYAGWGALISTLNALVQYAVYLGVIIAALFIAYGGFLLVLNPMNPENRSKAKSVMLNTVIGLFIVLAAWLLVNTLLIAIGFTQGGIQGATQVLSGGSNCNTGTSPNSLAATSPGGGATGTTSNGSTNGATCTGTNGNAQQLTGNAGGAYQYDNQISQLAAQDGISNQTDQLMGIVAQESGGNPNARSGAGAIGLMQLEPTTAAQYGVSACQGSSNSNPSAGCVSALENPQTNMQAGVKYYSVLYNQNNGNSTYATAGYNGGQGANRQSQTCPGQTQWQCQTNGGYAETRNYVSQVDNYANTIGGCNSNGSQTTGT